MNMVLDGGSYNATGSGFSGLNEMSNFGPTLAIIPLGLIILIVGVPLVLVIIHQINQNRKFREFLDRLYKIMEDRFLYGMYSWLFLGFAGMIYFGSSTETGQGILFGVAMCLGFVLGFGLLTVILGAITKPVWRWVFEYTQKKEVKA